MQQALTISEHALPLCKPNPPVGCVIVKDEKIIAQGHTLEPGKHHAEAAALAAAGPAAEGSSIYVTLEPCSFHGRTPSCAQALIDAKVMDVFVGVIDTDPRNNGKGIEMLQDAGIPVSVGILKHEIEEFLAPHLAKQSVS